MISYYFCSLLTFFFIYKSIKSLIKTKAPVSAFVAFFSLSFLFTISDMYFNWELLGADRYAPFKGSQLYWTCSFIMIFVLITLNNVYRGLLHSQKISELVRDLAIENERLKDHKEIA